MGITSKKLHAKLSKGGITDLPTGKQEDHPPVSSIQQLIDEGLDPIHAVYVFDQNITSYFAEGVSQLSEMKKFSRVVAKAEDDYLPSAPPMSPLTPSFFWTWAFHDLQFDGADTLASCLIEANDLVGMNPEQLNALKKLTASRMGIYEHVGMEGRHIRLRELVTNAEFSCYSTSGYRGKRGELWYVRLLPPLVPDLASYHIVFTTPYLLMASKDKWLQFLHRTLAPSGPEIVPSALHRFLKYGKEPNYWNEYVFKAYHNHQQNAIFLAGIPDLSATLPHA